MQPNGMLLKVSGPGTGTTEPSIRAVPRRDRYHERCGAVNLIDCSNLIHLVPKLTLGDAYTVYLGISHASVMSKQYRVSDSIG